MSLLRLYCPLLEAPTQCDWALLGDKAGPATGRSLLKDLSRRADRIQVVLPAADVLITQARLPAAARRGGAAMLAFAIEDRIVNDPEINQVTWLGKTGDDDSLAVFDRQGFERWRKALGDIGIRRFEVQCETLLLPRARDHWSVAWNGREGFVRCGELHAMTTDAGDAKTPPLGLRMLVDEARAAGKHPGAIALHVTHADAAPDLDAWEASLGVPVQLAGTWTWRSAALDAGREIAQESPRWFGIGEAFPRLRLAAWLVAAALLVHGIALAVDWALLAAEQRSLRQQMDARFRATFPDAMAVVDPLLQTRRKLAEARHAVGKPDAGDFLPMVEKVSNELKGLTPGAVRILSYDAGRMVLEANPADERSVSRILERLRQAGLSADANASAGRATISVRVP
jgi:general secretion pathway protein L